MKEDAFPPLSRETRFAPAGELRVPRAPGVYLIYDWRGPLYVGRTVNLVVRFRQHLDQSHNRGLRQAILTPFGPLRFAWGEVDPHQQPAIEAAAIALLKPRCNIVRYSDN